ncbi:uncharacterized protein RCC_04475 [Ramularia collo-cygni]|uniref:Uncharacterized protein n=1 Tax=Ramularia collo-cygni TaxID=112498 RepID=A0A2D3URJ1_9PEZI|nr:uncharacterized protein RCC_04475 [Ramularia collo-cygni]CZT18631.1 uncharacterized protein RCC_04475 [Ramularia collo-cygni]
MAPRTRSQTRRAGSMYSVLDVEGQSSADNSPQDSSSPTKRSKSASKTRKSSKRKAGDPTDDESDEPKLKRGRSSVEKGSSPKNQNGGPPEDEKELAPEDTSLCTMKATKDRNTFRGGNVISLPMHQPNMNPKLSASDKFLSRSYYGGVYSKSRMAVVLYRFVNRMMVLPMYSWDGDGITSQAKYTHVDYVEVWNETERRRYTKEGVHDVIGVTMTYKPLRKRGCLSLAGAFSVDYRENIDLVGDMPATERKKLCRLMERRMATVAKDDPNN